MTDLVGTSGNPITPSTAGFGSFDPAEIAPTPGAAITPASFNPTTTTGNDLPGASSGDVTGSPTTSPGGEFPAGGFQQLAKSATTYSWGQIFGNVGLIILGIMLIGISLAGGSRTTIIEVGKAALK